MALHPTRNIGLKLLSLVLAAILWFIIAREETSEAVVRAPVEFVNMPATLEIASDPPSQVEVRVRASSALMRRVNETGLTARIDLRTARPGRRAVQFSSDNFNLPFGCQVVKINPAGFDLDIEESDSKLAPVTPRVEGRVADGFEIVSIGTSPDKVLVRGPRSRVRRLSAVATEAVSVNGIVTSLSQSVPVRVGDPSCQLVGDATVRIDIAVVEKQEARVLEGVVVEAFPPAPAAIFPAHVVARVQGPRSRVRALDPKRVRALVDVAGLSPGPHTVAPRIVFDSIDDDTIKVLSVEPEKVRVTIR
ncbi:MAG: CdaR family protein [Acidobacteriota bacterium]